jgi:hypothetical protein
MIRVSVRTYAYAETAVPHDSRSQFVFTQAWIVPRRAQRDHQRAREYGGGLGEMVLGLLPDGSDVRGDKRFGRPEDRLVAICCMQ